MSFIDLQQLPFAGMSSEFVGADQGAPFSAYLVKAEPGKGPPLHIHPYVEVAFVIEGSRRSRSEKKPASCKPTGSRPSRLRHRIVL